MLNTVFVPNEIDRFRYVSWDLDVDKATVQLRYALDDVVEFTEVIGLPTDHPISTLSAQRRAALDRCLQLLWLVAGISYYKAAAPANIAIEQGIVDDETLSYLQALITHGLGEFAYVNSIPLPTPVITQVATSPTHAHSAPTAGLADRPLVAVGGGKDSCVSIELTRPLQPLLASVNTPRAITECIEASGLASVHATRKISPGLLRINQEGALNGHVPITAIVSVTLCALAILTDCNAVVMSNERSASEGNLEYNGVEINHQYSKSLVAEAQLASLIRSTVASDLQYFSLLRPLSELDIARRFSHTTRYDKAFTSCNRAFRIDESRRIDHWCGECDKCRFVFLALAPHVTPERLEGIFRRNLLDEPHQADGYDALIGWQANKPFECVGEVEESVAALLLLADRDEWRNTYIVKRFMHEIHPRIVVPSDIRTRPFVESPAHSVPLRYLELFDAAS